MGPDFGDPWNGWITFFCLVLALVIWLDLRSNWGDQAARDNDAAAEPEPYAAKYYICSDAVWAQIESRVHANRGKVRWAGYVSGLTGVLVVGLVLESLAAGLRPADVLFVWVLVGALAGLAAWAGGQRLAETVLNGPSTEQVVRVAREMNLKLSPAGAAALVANGVIAVGEFSYRAFHADGGVWLV